MDLDTITCDCTRPTMVWDHDATCALWEHPEFGFGDILWDGSKLVEMREASGSLFSKAMDEFDDEIEDAEPADVLSDALVDIGEDADSQDTWDAAVALIGGETVALLMSLVPDALEIDVVERALLEAFGTQVLGDATKGVATYTCYCNPIAVTLCAKCGVHRDNKADPWVPTRRRIRREIGLFLSGKTFECEHAATTKWECRECDVQRWDATCPWTFLNSEAAVDEASNPTLPAVSSGWEVYGGGTYYQKCRHYGEIVKLPDGTPIMCSSQHTRKADDETRPQIGCYMASGWSPEWVSYYLNWTDHGVPKVPDADVLWLIDTLLSMARAGTVVEIGCIGGHGRTGSLLAIMALKAGITDAKAAMDFVWKDYCKEAIESTKQEWYIAKMAALIHGGEIPEEPQSACTRWEHEKLWKEKKVCGRGVHCQRDWDLDVIDFTKPKSHTSYVSPAVTWGGIGDPINPDTKVPPYADSHGSCSLRRHEILFWRREPCNCKLADSDWERFVKQGKPRVEDVSLLVKITRAGAKSNKTTPTKESK